MPLSGLRVDSCLVRVEMLWGQKVRQNAFRARYSEVQPTLAPENPHVLVIKKTQIGKVIKHNGKHVTQRLSIARLSR